MISHHTHPHTTSYLETQGHIVLHTGAFRLLGFCSLVLKLMLVRILKKGIFKYIYTAYTSGYFIYKILVNKCCFFFSPRYLFAQGLNTDPQRNSFKDNCDNDVINLLYKRNCSLILTCSHHMRTLETLCYYHKKHQYRGYNLEIPILDSPQMKKLNDDIFSSSPKQANFTFFCTIEFYNTYMLVTLQISIIHKQKLYSKSM